MLNRSYEDKGENMNNTVICDAHLIDLFGKDDEILGTILWGIVISDASERFNPGDYVFTTPVISISGSNYQTRNSQYEVNGVVTKLRLPIQHILYLRAGIHPQLCVDKSQTDSQQETIRSNSH